MSFRFSAASLVLGLFVAVAAGCSRGPKMYPVSGLVTLAGKPLPNAAVLLYRKDMGRPPETRTDAAGVFRLSSPAGEYTAVIVACQSLVPQSGMETSEVDPTKVKWIVPEKYSRFDQSDLKVTVQPGGENHFRFDFPRK